MASAGSPVRANCACAGRSWDSVAATHSHLFVLVCLFAHNAPRPPSRLQTQSSDTREPAKRDTAGSHGAPATREGRNTTPVCLLERHMYLIRALIKCLAADKIPCRRMSAVHCAASTATAILIPCALNAANAIRGHRGMSSSVGCIASHNPVNIPRMDWECNAMRLPICAGFLAQLATRDPPQVPGCRILCITEKTKNGEGELARRPMVYEETKSLNDILWRRRQSQRPYSPNCPAPLLSKPGPARIP